MDLFIIRHADPCYDPDSLTERGHEEARALAQRLADLRVDHVYSSPSNRARLTAEYTATALGLEIVELTWLLELSEYRVGQQNGEHAVWDILGSDVRGAAKMPGMDDWWELPSLRRSGIGQKWPEFRSTVDAFLADFGYVRTGEVYQVRSPSPSRVALFCHNGTLLFLLAHLLALPPSLVWCGFYAWPSSMTRIHFEELTPQTAVPRALHVADVSHLIAAGLRPNPRGRGSGVIPEYE